MRSSESVGAAKHALTGACSPRCGPGVISVGLRMSNAIAAEEGSTFTLLHELDGENTETGSCTGYVYRVDRDSGA